MRLALEIEQDNDAFRGPWTVTHENYTEASHRAKYTAELLREAADRIEAGSDEGTLKDFNGNTVGRWATFEN